MRPLRPTPLPRSSRSTAILSCRPTSCLAPATTTTTISCFLSVNASPPPASNTSVPATMACAADTSRRGPPASSARICWRTSMSTRGMASIAARRSCGRPTSMCRCAVGCCGSTKARHSTGGTCWPPAPGSCRSSRRSISSPTTPPPTRRARAANGARWSTPRSTPSLRRADPCPGTTGSVARTITRKANSSGWMSTR